MIKRFENALYANKIAIAKLTLEEIPTVINSAYLKGVEDIDTVYREAIAKACEECEINSSRFFMRVLNHLNN